MNGWWNSLARVDLSSGEVTYEEIGEGVLEEYIGGRGLGARLLVEEIDPGVDPLQDNVLVFTAGPLTGTSVLTSGRFSVTSKSPLTGTMADSNVGGSLGKEFKRAGIDALLVEGEAEEPVQIEITEEEINVLETDLWGLETSRTVQNLKGESAVIGPAGENEVKYASIVTNGHRVFGRGGLGAVMGSKKLKSVTVSGSKKVPVADEDALKKYVKKAASKIDSSPVTSRGLKKFGTPILVNLLTWLGMFSKHNYREAAGEEEADNLSGERMSEELSGHEIRMIYMLRWMIEIFFRDLKQSAQIEHLINRSENGILIQVYSTLIAYTLVNIFRVEHGIWLSMEKVSRKIKHHFLLPYEKIDFDSWGCGKGPPNRLYQYESLEPT